METSLLVARPVDRPRHATACRDSRISAVLRMSRVLCVAAVAACAAQILVGAVWWTLQLGAVPAYGDTPEYLRLSTTLEVDGFRTLAYPVLVKGAVWVAGVVGWLPWQVPLYLLQTVVLVVASVYLVRTVLPDADRRVVALAAAVVATGPLQLHYATAVLSDSLAASSFLLALAAGARVVLGDRRVSTVALGAAGALAAALLRTEKAAVLLAVAAAFVVVALLVGRGVVTGSGRAARLRVAVSVVLVLLVPAVLAAGANRATQTADLGRPHAGTAAVAVSRIVWPHLEQIHPDLPAAVRDEVTLEDARAFDHHNNNALPMTARLRALGGGDDAYAYGAARAAVACCGTRIVGDVVGDVAEYTVVPLTFAREALPVLGVEQPADTPTAWNVTRMRAAHPAATTAFLGVAFVALAVLIVAAAVSAVSGGRRDLRAAGLVVLGTVANGAAFALAQGADANVRYGLPNAMAVTALLLAVVLGGARPAPRRPRHR